MADEPDYILDIGHLDEPSEAEAQEAKSRPWIGIQFDCCGVYVRIYRNPTGTAYVGHCPRCMRKAEVQVGPGGSAQRIFRAT